MKKKKVTQETANRLRELLEKVISEREDAVPLPKKRAHFVNRHRQNTEKQSSHKWLKEF